MKMEPLVSIQAWLFSIVFSNQFGTLLSRFLLLGMVRSTQMSIQEDSS